MKKFFLFIILITLVGFSTGLAQTLTVEPFGVSPRDAEEDTVLQYFDRPYNGLLNVGVGTKMFFKAHFEDTTLTAPTWQLLIKPANSLAVIGTTLDVDTSTQICSFIPDTVGTYNVVFTDGEFTETLTINAGLYLGVLEDQPPCVGCHNTPDWDYKYDEWLGTGHASMLERGLNGTLSSHYGESCIKCHTTGYDPNADNNGFDDFGFIFPDTLFVGQYDLMLVTYPDAMARANIQCESCHGPGSRHFGVTDDSRMVVTLSTDNCAWCHDEGTHHAFPEQWDHSGEDATEFDGRGFDGGHARGSFVQSAGTRSGCSPCHSGAGYVEWNEEGRPTNSDGLPTATTILPTATNHSCAVCHDPHSDENIHQLRSVETQLGDGTPITFDKYGTGVLCMDCHRSRRYAKDYASDVNNGSSHYGAHHGPQADMMVGKNAPDYGIDFPTSPHAIAGGNSCNDCHMAGDLADAQGNINVVGGHSWNMNDAEGNDFVEACATCHGDIGTSFTDKKYFINGNADLDNNGTAEGLQLEVKGLLEQLSAFLPHNEDGEVLIDDGNVEGMALTPAIMRGGYVYVWIEEDRSFGVHNPAFTVSLIKAALDELGGVTSFEYPKSGIPQAYQLSQNYPNPFNPSTTIEYTIPEQSNVKITIYDALGKEVEVLFNGEQSAGLHRLDWNASSYASGIYFYRMNTGSFAQVKKMLLLK